MSAASAAKDSASLATAATGSLYQMVFRYCRAVVDHRRHRMHARIEIRRDGKQRTAGMVFEIIDRAREPRALFLTERRRIPAGEPELRSDRPREHLNARRVAGQSMRGNNAAQARHAFGDMHAQAPVTRTGLAAMCRPVPRMQDLMRTRSEQIVIERDDNLALIEAMVLRQGAAEGKRRAGIAVPFRGLVPMPAHFRIGFGKRTKLPDQRRRGRPARQDAQAFALPLAPARAQVAQRLVERAPG